MESSFKKEYEKQTLPDGSVEISFKSKRVGAWGAGFALFISFALFVGLWLGIVAIQMSMGNDDPSAMLSAVIAFVVTWVIVGVLVDKKSTITVKPSEGLIFEGKQLPFSDIQTIGVSHQTTSKNATGSAYVYATSYGKEIKLTAHMPESRAAGIKSALLAASGMEWNAA